MYCPNCGKKLSDRDAFCTRCGAKVSTSPNDPGDLKKVPAKDRGKKNNRILVVVILIVLLVCISASIGAFYFGRSKRNHLEERLSIGERYLSELDYDRALAAFDEALEIEPRNEDALVGIAQAYEGRGMKNLEEGKPFPEVREDLKAAKDYYEQAAMYHPSSGKEQEVQDALERVNETLAYHPEQKSIYKLKGEEYMSTSPAKISGRLIKSKYSPPVSNYTIYNGKQDFANYTLNGEDGYQYIVRCEWGLHLEEPIKIENNGQVTTVEEIGLVFLDNTEPPTLQENDFCYCEGYIQDFYQMDMDKFHDNGDKNLIATEKNIDREGYRDGAKDYSSIHIYYSFGNYVISLSEMKRIGGDENNQESTEEEPQNEGLQNEEKAEDSKLTGWAGAKKRPLVRYDDAISKFDDLLQTFGKGKTEFKCNYEIVTSFTTWQDGTGSFSSSSKTQSYAFTAENQSDLGLLYAAGDDYDGDGTAELIGFRTEAVTDNFGNPWIYLYIQLNKFGQESIEHELSEKLDDTTERSYVVADHYLITVIRVYGSGGHTWPLSEAEVDEYNLNFVETIEVRDLNDLSNVIFNSTREVGNYLPEDYDCILETQVDRYYWNKNYSTSDSVSLHEINDEGKMLSVIEEKLTELVGETVISLSPLRWENRWSALTFTEPSSVLQIKTDFDPVSVEERDNGSKRVGASTFIVKTTVPTESEE